MGHITQIFFASKRLFLTFLIKNCVEFVHGACQLVFQAHNFIQRCLILLCDAVLLLHGGQRNRNIFQLINANVQYGCPHRNVFQRGNALRTILSLRSPSFTVEYKDNAFTFHVTGYGHGVGMSQYGAMFMAEQGYTYEDILKFYYTDTEIG